MNESKKKRVEYTRVDLNITRELAGVVIKRKRSLNNEVAPESSDCNPIELP
jgi:hypothetical protein